jgi:hypothetical protein
MHKSRWLHSAAMLGDAAGVKSEVHVVCQDLSELRSSAARYIHTTVVRHHRLR